MADVEGGASGAAGSRQSLPLQLPLQLPRHESMAQSPHERNDVDVCVAATVAKAAAAGIDRSLQRQHQQSQCQRLT